MITSRAYSIRKPERAVIRVIGSIDKFNRTGSLVATCISSVRVKTTMSTSNTIIPYPLSTSSVCCGNQRGFLENWAERVAELES